MSSASFLFSKLARADIAQIRKYTLEKWGKTQWLLYKNNLFKQFQALAQNSTIGLPLNDISPNAFRFPIENHIVYYLQRPQDIVVVGVISTQMAPKEHSDRQAIMKQDK